MKRTYVALGATLLLSSTGACFGLFDYLGGPDREAGSSDGGPDSPDSGADAGPAADAGACAIITAPAIGTFTADFDASKTADCECSEDKPLCHTLYAGQIASIHPDGWHADLRFRKVVNNSEIPAGLAYWVVAAEHPTCSGLTQYEVVAEGTTDLNELQMDLKNVPIWPDEASYTKAPPGATRSLLLVTGGTGFNGIYMKERIWFERAPLTFTKTCPPCKSPPCALWSKGFPATSYQVATGVVADGSGGVIVTGYVDGVVDLGGGVRPTSGGGDLLVAKLDARGAYVWDRVLGDGASQQGAGVAVDAAGNVVVTGFVDGALGFGEDVPSSAGNDVFVAKLDAGGEHVWAKRFGDAATQRGKAIAVDSAGDILVAGDFDGTIAFGGDVLSSKGGDDVFVAKLDTSGDPVWSHGFGDQNVAQGATSIAVGLQDRVVVAGAFRGTMDFGGGPLVGSGGNNVFVVELDRDGHHSWSKRFGDDGAPSDATASGVAVSPSGHVVVAGSFAGSLSLPGGSLKSLGDTDIFVMELDAAGGYVWSLQMGTSGADTAGGLALDHAGNLFLTGRLGDGEAVFDGVKLAGAGGGDAFLLKLDAQGHPIWSGRFGDANDQNGLGVASDPQGNAVLAGVFRGQMDLGNGPLQSGAVPSMFLGKFAP